MLFALTLLNYYHYLLPTLYTIYNTIQFNISQINQQCCINMCNTLNYDKWCVIMHNVFTL